MTPARFHRVLLQHVVWAAVALAPAVGHAQVDTADAEVADLDIEQLGRIRITSAARRPEPASRASAALFVITRDDIRRSGAVSLPEALRLAPGLQVARVTARDWSITARGFAEQSPNKLLVLVDGRAVYSPLFAGVFWDVQDVVLEDVDRIEVILGSGATLWGSNAVNGVINVITRPATDTRSRLVALRGGTADHLGATGRWGTGLGAAGALRVYGRYRDREGSRFGNGSEAEDDWRQGQGGFRLDFDASPRDRLTVQGDAYSGNGGQLIRRALLEPPFTETVDDELDADGANLLGRWTRRSGDRSELQVQAYFDHATRTVPSSFGRVAVDIADVELQHRVPLGRRHDVVWGVGYRLNRDSLSGTFPLRLEPGARTTHLATAFAQDEIELAASRWYLTLGAKLERNTFSGVELQPNLRVLWLPSPSHTVWSAVSRAVRIPSRLDTDISFIAQVVPTSPPLVLRFEGDEGFRSEELVSWEAGWRAHLHPTVSVDASLYYAWYDRLRSLRSMAPVTEGDVTVQPVTIANDARGDAYGGTLALHWFPRRSIRVQASYTLLEMDVSLYDDAPPGSTANVSPGFNPEHQGAIRAALAFPRGVELDLALRYVGELPSPRIPDYLEADARLGWTIRPGLTVAVLGRDLLADRHPEFSSAPQREVPRRGEIQLEWRF